jgi:hypothetical protein
MNRKHTTSSVLQWISASRETRRAIPVLLTVGTTATTRDTMTKINAGLVVVLFVDSVAVVHKSRQ